MVSLAKLPTYSSKFRRIEMFINLPNVNIRMLGNHQLQNAVAATCTALLLQNQGFLISDKCVRAGLEQTQLLGRSQFLSDEEAEALGVSETSIFVDGAHTEASAEGFSDVIRMTYPDRLSALVVAMASDKKHQAFARQFLTGQGPDIVLLIEASIAGGKSRTTPASTLKDTWTRTAVDLGLDFKDLELMDEKTVLHDLNVLEGSTDNRPLTLVASQNISVRCAIKFADRFLKANGGNEPRLIVVTGSLHIVSSVLTAVAATRHSQIQETSV